jgi:hypothetical protein
MWYYEISIKLNQHLRNVFFSSTNSLMANEMVNMFMGRITESNCFRKRRYYVELFYSSIVKIASSVESYYTLVARIFVRNLKGSISW